MIRTRARRSFSCGKSQPGFTLGVKDSIKIPTTDCTDTFQEDSLQRCRPSRFNKPYPSPRINRCPQKTDFYVPLNRILQSSPLILHLLVDPTKLNFSTPKKGVLQLYFIILHLLIDTVGNKNIFGNLIPMSIFAA